MFPATKCDNCGGKGCGCCLTRRDLRIRRGAEMKAANAARKAAHVATQKECQICERNQCINAHGLMVLHGYKRPGYGFIEGSCFGVGFVDYSQGTDALEQYRDVLRRMLDDAKSSLARYVRGEVTHFQTESQEYAKDERGRLIYIGRKVQYVPVITSWAPGVSDATQYAKHLQSKHNAAATRVEQVQNELTRVERRIAAWVAPKASRKKSVAS